MHAYLRTMAEVQESKINSTWIFFIFGFIMMLITLPVVTYRYIKYPVKLEQNINYYAFYGIKYTVCKRKTKWIIFNTKMDYPQF